jgi:predicted MPP superfamily phosphohydrolase
VSFILTIIGLMLGLDIAWWWISARLARRSTWRRVVAIFMGFQVAGLALIIFARMLHRGWDHWLPKFVVSAVFIWHFLGISLLLVVGLVLLPVLLFRAITCWSRRGKPEQLKRADDRTWSRRDFVGLAAAVIPPLYTFGLTGVALTQLSQFRVRRFVLPIPDLPPDLDGISIAQVSDMHVGRFTSGRVLRKMVEVVNQMRADLVLLTGDLINDALADLSSGLDFVRAMEARFGLFIIEGNHDLIENPSEFEHRVKQSGIPFLLDEAAVISVRGAPVQLLGLSWTRARENRDAAIASAVRGLIGQRRPDAFPILLAHHPHAFDAAAESQMPLTLSGHTHGGQLMLNEQLGFGPALFRYWSGLYTRAQSKLIVSNGVGNWFPLRVNAPAEIIHLTLRRE